MPTAVHVCIYFSANPDKTSNWSRYTHQANTNSCVHLSPILCPTQTRHQPTTYTVNSVTELCSHTMFILPPTKTRDQPISTHTPGHRHKTIHVQSIYICVSMSDNHDKRLTNTRPGLKTLYKILNIYYIIYMSAATSLLTKTSKTKQKSTNQSPHQDKALSCLPQHQLLCQPRQD